MGNSTQRVKKPDDESVGPDRPALERKNIPEGVGRPRKRSRWGLKFFDVLARHRKEGLSFNPKKGLGPERKISSRYKIPNHKRRGNATAERSRGSVVHGVHKIRRELILCRREKR